MRVWVHTFGYFCTRRFICDMFRTFYLLFFLSVLLFPVYGLFRRVLHGKFEDTVAQGASSVAQGAVHTVARTGERVVAYMQERANSTHQ